MDPVPFPYFFLEENNGIKYVKKDVKLKNDEDRTSYIHIDYDANKIPKLTKKSFKEIMIQDNNKGGRIGDPVEVNFEQFKRKNLYEYFVKSTKSKAKNCRWFFAY